MGNRNHEEIIGEWFREVGDDKTAPKVTTALLPPSLGFGLRISSGCTTSLLLVSSQRSFAWTAKELLQFTGWLSFQFTQHHHLCFSGESFKPNPSFDYKTPHLWELLCARGLPFLVFTCVCLFKSLLSELCVLMYSLPSVLPTNPGLIHSVHVFW